MNSTHSISFETKFKIGDKVYFVSHHRVMEGEVSGITWRDGLTCYYGSSAGTSNSTVEYTVCYNDGNHTGMNGSVLFSTREELIASL